MSFSTTNYLELLISLHFIEWISEPGHNAPSIRFSVRGDLSQSPYWILARPGILAPIIKYKLLEKARKEMKLHLGCGENYLQGYHNIDFPPASHTIQTVSVADEYADILQLCYPAGFIEEVRLHHVFEHFSRPTALALLTSWWSWLSEGGVLRIEVPDFYRCARVVINPFSTWKKKHVALRHIFGSQEASWAYHMEGWSGRGLQRLVERFGYSTIKTKHNAYQGTYNIEILAKKTDGEYSKHDFEKCAREWLTLYTVNHSDTEQRILEVWMKEYQNQVERSWAK